VQKRASGRKPPRFINRWLSLVCVLVVVGFFLVGPGQTAARAQGGPTITSVSTITAQNDSITGEESGPGIIINGSGFGTTPPTVCQADNDTMLGESAIGLDVLTNNLQIIDKSEGIFNDQYMGNCSNEPVDDCDVSIGSWSDTQIVVLLDDTGFLDCHSIESGDDLSVQVFSTDAGNAGSNVVDTTAVGEGTVASVAGLSPASGPVAGGTFNADGSTNPNGTITITGSNLTGTSIVWFGNGGDDGAVATTNFTMGTDSSGNPDIIVTPPPAPAGYDEGTDIVLTGGGGTSGGACAAIDEGCEGTYYWQSPSTVLPTISGSTGPLNINATLSFNAGWVSQKGACPGSSPAGGTGASFSATASVTGGPLDFSGQFQTSENDKFLSSLQAPITVTVESPVTVAITLSGSVSGCYAVPIPDLSIPGLGGLYILIGGNLSVGYTFTATINRGTFVVDAGYVANQVDGASVVSQNCTDGSGNPAPCIQTSSNGEISGTLTFSPLWLGVDITDIPGLTFSAGAGLTFSAFVTDSTTTGFDYDVCFGGTYAVVGSVGEGAASVSISTQGVFFGPFNIFGDGTVCPLGAIGSTLPPTTTTLASSKPSGVAVGSPVTYTATVNPSDGNGTVSFAADGSPIASCESQPVNASGEATCDQTYTGTGSHSIVATFGGDTADAGSVSSALTQDVTGSLTSTTTTVTSSPADPSTVSQMVTYTATVSPTPDGGTVSFSDGGTPLSNCQGVALSSGQAICDETYLGADSHPIVASYSGDASFGGSTSNTFNQGVSNSLTGTTTGLASSGSPSTAGQTVTYTATVSPTDNGGGVTFTDGGTPIAGCESVALVSGKADCPQTYTDPGKHSIVATYSGDNSFGGSVSSALDQVVNSSVTATTTVLTSTANPSSVKQQVTYTATVSPTDNGGTVSFADGGTAISGCQSVVLSAGVAKCPQTYTAGGSHSIVATYSGDTSYATSTSTTLAQDVNSSLTATATKLVSSANPATVGVDMTYTATVSPSANGGTVDFTYGGTTLPGCGAVALTSSKATCTVKWISAGTASIVATYGGNATFAASSSNAICQVVGSGAAPTTTTLLTSANPAKVGATVIYTATVKPTATGGTVTFTYDGKMLPGCGAVALNSSWQAKCAIVWISAGTASIVATYSGDTDYGGSKSATLDQVVTSTVKATTTTLVSSANPIADGVAMTYTATVKPTANGGKVDFTYGGKELPDCGAVTLNTESSKATCAIVWSGEGTASIEATYSGDSKYGESISNIVTQFVGFTAKATPSSTTYGHAVTLSASGLAAAATGKVIFTDPYGGSFCTATVSKGGASCVTAASLIPGTYDVVAEYSGNEATETTATSFVTTKIPTSMKAEATPASTSTGKAVTLSASGLPTGATGTVTFASSGKTLCTATTVSKGAASCQTSKTLKAGKYPVTATYSGNGDYAKTTATTTFTIT